MIKKIPRALFYIMFAMLFIILFFVMLNVTENIRRIVFRSLRPVFYGAALAYLFKPMCNFFDKRMTRLFSKRLKQSKAKKLSHYLSMLATYIIYGAIIYFLLSIIIPKLAKSIIQLVSSIPEFYNSIMLFVQRIVDENPFLAENIGRILDVIYQGFNSWYQSSLFPLLSEITNGVMLTFTFILNLVIGIIVSVYLLNGRKKLGAQVKMIIKSIFPKNFADAIFSEASFVDKMFSGYFAGTLIDSALVGVLCYIICLVTKMPFPVLVSVIVGVLNIIPFFGPYIGMIPSALIILTVSPVKAIVFVVAIWILQQIDGNIIAPKIIGSNTGLSGFWVLFAILLFGGLFGFFGMIIGSPVFAVIYNAVGKLVRKYAKIKGEHEFVKSYDDEFCYSSPEKTLRYRLKVRKIRQSVCEGVKTSVAEIDSQKTQTYGRNAVNGSETAQNNIGEIISRTMDGQETVEVKKIADEYAEQDTENKENNLQISFF